MKRIKTILTWAILVFIFLTLYNVKKNSRPELQHRQFSFFVTDVHKHQVSSVEVDGERIIVHTTNKDVYKVEGTLSGKLLDDLIEDEVPVSWKTEDHYFTTLLTSFGPLLLILALWYFFFKRAQKGGLGMLGLRNTNVRLITQEERTSFADVGGCNEAKKLLGDIVDYLKDSSRWKKMNVRAPRGILLEGPPGCGKTLLARAIAGEIRAKFFHLSGSDFVEMFVGVGAARVRDTFETAIRETPAVLFIDELDAVGKRRGSGVSGAHDEREQTLNQLLVCLDGVTSYSQLIVIAATNRADTLDKALLRAGRFDRVIKIGLPTLEQRVQVLEVHTKNKVLDDEVSLLDVAKSCNGFSGADLETLVNEAAILALRRVSSKADPLKITKEDLLEARGSIGGLSRGYSVADAVLIESASQITKAKADACIKVTLRDSTSYQGVVVWADGTFIKLSPSTGDAVTISKSFIKLIEAIGTDNNEDTVGVETDPWANRPTEVA
jgi:cell division protease FtsH